MKKIIAKIAVIIGCIILCIAVLLGVFVGLIKYFDEYHITRVGKSVSPDGEYELIFEQVGNPWFTADPIARIILKKDNKKLQTKQFTLLTDGVYLSDDFWNVKWYSQSVEVSFTYETYGFSNPIILYFDE